MSKYDPFNLTDCTYKTVDDHQINLSILTPKTMQAGKYPVIIRYHGGYLITGTRLLPDWFPQWTLDLALATPAILLTPDYRLLPECNGPDILADVRSLFTWLREKLSFTLSSLSTPIEADLDHILVCGESAGGYLAAQSALLLGRDNGITAAAVAYGVLDIKVPFFTQAFEKVIVGYPMTGPGVLDAHLDRVKRGEEPKVASEGAAPLRTELAMHVVQYGLLANLLGAESECYPLENLERAAEGKVPSLWLYHGRQDTAVPVEGSIAFAERVKEVRPEVQVKLTVLDGEHGLDNQEGVSMETPWVKDGLAFITKAWLSSQAQT